MTIKMIITSFINGVDTLIESIKTTDVKVIDNRIVFSKSGKYGYMVILDTGIDYHFFLHTDRPYEVDGELIDYVNGVLPYDEFGDYFGYEPDTDYEYENYCAHPYEYLD